MAKLDLQDQEFRLKNETSYQANKYISSSFIVKFSLAESIARASTFLQTKQFFNGIVYSGVSSIFAAYFEMRKSAREILELFY